MTRLFNDPASFTEDMLAGFLDANARYVVGVPGGVVRATETPPGKVAVVVGGGSGHYPAFCGVVGPGFADGAVVGNVFTSPTARQAASVARAAHGDSGVLLITGNYAGDVMNFGLAVTELANEGIDARFLTVTDDIASAPVDEAGKRRGIAGDFAVFRCASAAAEAGYSLDDVELVARTTNAATRTLGVAFDGCTMPGGEAPLFTVPASWTSPADTPAYKRGSVTADPAAHRRTAVDAEAAVSEQITGDAESRIVAGHIVSGLGAVHRAVVEAEDELARIDAVAGDSDHGRGMVRGLTAAVEAARKAATAGAGAGRLVRDAGEAWAAQAGGTSGVLWGAALTSAGKRLGDNGTPTSQDIADAVAAGYTAMLDLGGAQLGDKTMLDAIGPFSDALTVAVDRCPDWRAAWRESAEIAAKSAAATADMVPKVGRARPLAERSVGTPDAGATSFALCVTTIVDLLAIH